MTIQATGLFSGAAQLADWKNPPGQSADAAEFLAYMQKSPAERMQEQWLAAHGLTREELEAMEPEQRETILKQMAEEMKEKMREKTAEEKPKGPSNLYLAQIY